MGEETSEGSATALQRYREHVRNREHVSRLEVSSVEALLRWAATVTQADMLEMGDDLAWCYEAAEALRRALEKERHWQGERERILARLTDLSPGAPYGQPADLAPAVDELRDRIESLMQTLRRIEAIPTDSETTDADEVIGLMQRVAHRARQVEGRAQYDVLPETWPESDAEWVDALADSYESAEAVMRLRHIARRLRADPSTVDAMEEGVAELRAEARRLAHDRTTGL